MGIGLGVGPNMSKAYDAADKVVEAIYAQANAVMMLAAEQRITNALLLKAYSINADELEFIEPEDVK